MTKKYKGCQPEPVEGEWNIHRGFDKLNLTMKNFFSHPNHYNYNAG